MGCQVLQPQGSEVVQAKLSAFGHKTLKESLTVGIIRITLNPEKLNIIS